jgi:Ser/Thr protein kinase RdoA (MazF antagonist)
MNRIDLESLDLICKKFTVADARLISARTGGLINDTYLLNADNKMYVIQRINKNMDRDRLLFNYGLYSKAFDEAEWLYPKWMKSNEGKYFVTDEAGDNWRMYPFVKCELLDKKLSKDYLFAIGEGLARMHKIFDLMEDKPKAVYPDLHDLNHYFDKYDRVLNGEGLLSENRDGVLEKEIDSNREKMLGIKTDKDSVIHADTKLSNILFVKGKVAGTIDMDTIMSGSVLEDIADCIRSSCVNNGFYDKDAAETIIKGYVSNTYKDKKEIIEGFPFVFEKICFELALRYYTDSISEEKYFKETYPGYCRERAKSLLGLVKNV